MTTTTISTTTLDEYLKVKREFEALKTILELKKKKATEEAEQLIKSGGAKKVQGGKYQYGEFKFQIQNKTVKPSEPPIVGELKRLLEREQTRAKMANLPQITQLQEQLNMIQEEMDKLSNTDVGREIENQIEEIMNAVEVEKRPQLNVYL